MATCTVLDPAGTIPVTAMHSKECHYAAGGWKGELDSGLEDVEYWIAAGKAGFCGKHIPEIVLLYRKHEESRSATLRRSKQESRMRNRIREMHSDVYRGEYPMGCCGSGAAYVPPPSNASVSMPLTLDMFPSSEKVWVEYVGQAQGFGIVGQFTNHSYAIDQPGHKLEVHVNDLNKFRHAGRGAHFRVGVPPPNGFTPPPPPSGPQAFVASEPELAQILQLDKVAA